MNMYFMGGDVSKGYSDFIILSHKKTVVEDYFQLDDSKAGHASLYHILETFFRTYPDASLHVGLESTGGYENNWYAMFQSYSLLFPLHVVRLNPFTVHHYSKAILKRTITDKVSAHTIATYLIAHHDSLRYDEQNSHHTARRLWQFISCLTKQKTQLLNQLNSLVYIANPELLQYCHEGLPQWVMKVLLRYPTARSLAHARVKTLARIPYVTQHKAQELIDAAQNSVASSTDETMTQLLRDIIKQIQHKENELNRQIKKLEKFEKLREIQLLCTIPGTALSSAVGLYLEIAPLSRFPSSKHLVSFLGIHPVFKMSGDGISGRHMSKQGRAKARGILFMMAKNAVRYDEHFRTLYSDFLHRGMKSKAAYGAIMNKLCRVIYGMLTSNTPYDPAIDQSHRAKMTTASSQNRSNTARRYQEMDDNAPISHRQRRKREEQKQSQNSQQSHIRDQVPAHYIDTTQEGGMSSEHNQQGGHLCDQDRDTTLVVTSPG